MMKRGGGREKGKTRGKGEKEGEILNVMCSQEPGVRSA
jgi:hypothetical protein